MEPRREVQMDWKLESNTSVVMEKLETDADDDEFSSTSSHRDRGHTDRKKKHSDSNLEVIDNNGVHIMLLDISRRNKKPFICPHCDHRFRDAGGLRSHLQTHPGRKPYSCKICLEIKELSVAKIMEEYAARKPKAKRSHSKSSSDKGTPEKLFKSEIAHGKPYPQPEHLANKSAKLPCGEVGQRKPNLSKNPALASTLTAESANLHPEKLTIRASLPAERKIYKPSSKKMRINKSTLQNVTPDNSKEGETLILKSPPRKRSTSTSPTRSDDISRSAKKIKISPSLFGAAGKSKLLSPYKLQWRERTISLSPVRETMIRSALKKPTTSSISMPVLLNENMQSNPPVVLNENPPVLLNVSPPVLLNVSPPVLYPPVLYPPVILNENVQPNPPVPITEVLSDETVLEPVELDTFIEKEKSKGTELLKDNGPSKPPSLSSAPITLGNGNPHEAAGEDNTDVPIFLIRNGVMVFKSEWDNSNPSDEPPPLITNLPPPVPQTLFKCDQCQRCFAFEAHLKLHVKNHNEKPVDTPSAEEHSKSHSPVPNTKTSKRPRVSWSNDLVSLVDVQIEHRKQIPRPPPVSMSFRRNTRNSKAEKTITCQYCDHVFSSYSDLEDPSEAHNCEMGKKKVAPTSGELQDSSDSELTTTYFVNSIEPPNEELKCQVCGKYLKSFANLRNHTMIHTGEAPFKCKNCSSCFLYHERLRRHMRVCVSREGNVCKYCKEVFSNFDELMTHAKIHRGKKPLKCKECPKRFMHLDGLKKHMRFHTGETPFTCQICQKSFMYEHSFKYHTSRKQHLCTCCRDTFESCLDLKNHSGDYSCEECQKIFPCPDGLLVHTKSHTGENPFKCELCQKTFPLRTNLNYHTSKKQHLCTCCRDTFESCLDLKNHSGDYHCEECQKMFPCPDGLLAHTKIHTGENPFNCELCQKTFPLRTNLNYHSNRENTCRHCKVIFNTCIDLVNHSVIHKGEKLHQCNFCLKGFRCFSELTIHMSIHTGEKPYNCHKCEKGFREKSLYKIHTTREQHSCQYCKENFNSCLDLKNHSTIHKGASGTNTDEKPYHCQHCQKSFGSHSNLKYHTSRKEHFCRCCKEIFSDCLDLKSHTGDELQSCTECQKPLRCSTEVKEHIRFHEVGDPFKCEKCQKCFTGRYLLKHHTERTHYFCQYCKENFENCSAYQIHRQVHKNGPVKSKVHMSAHTGKKTYKCQLCQRSFPGPYLLRKHVTKRYFCQHCKEHFNTCVDYQNHCKVVHNDKRTKPPCPNCDRILCKCNSFLRELTKIVANESGRFNCTQCENSYSRRSHLIRHVRKTHIAKPQTCKHCDLVFEKPNEFKTHYIIHSDEKFNTCRQCNIGFNSLSNLLEHVKNHNEEKLAFGGSEVVEMLDPAENEQDMQIPCIEL